MTRCSLYVHIPFCRSKCRYCDFYSTVGAEDLVDRYIDALAAEWYWYSERNEFEIASVFIGGGTPSVLTVSQWERLQRCLLSKLPLIQDAEWTVECNPDSLTTAKIDLFAAMGVTRVSIGVQSLDDRELATMGRPHSAQLALDVLDNPSLARLGSVGVDLMYGLPGQTVQSLSRTVSAVTLKGVVGHISTYELTIAENTPFGRHRKLLPLPGDEEIGEMAEVLSSILSGEGFEQYEVSNFARQGQRCRHNCAYWDHSPYLGLGCAAHSYMDMRRWRNLSDVEKYCAMVNNGDTPVEDEEIIDTETLAREMVFLRLLTADGLNESVFREKTGLKFVTWAGEERLQRFADNQLLIHQPPWWRPSRRGMQCADYIARELF